LAYPLFPEFGNAPNTLQSDPTGLKSAILLDLINNSAILRAFDEQCYQYLPPNTYFINVSFNGVFRNQI
jgi:hypothetical protein